MQLWDRTFSTCSPVSLWTNLFQSVSVLFQTAGYIMPLALPLTAALYFSQSAAQLPSLKNPGHGTYLAKIFSLFRPSFISRWGVGLGVVCVASSGWRRIIIFPVFYKKKNPQKTKQDRDNRCKTWISLRNERRPFRRQMQPRRKMRRTSVRRKRTEKRKRLFPSTFSFEEEGIIKLETIISH